MGQEEIYLACDICGTKMFTFFKEFSINPIIKLFPYRPNGKVEQRLVCVMEWVETPGSPGHGSPFSRCENDSVWSTHLSYHSKGIQSMQYSSLPSRGCPDTIPIASNLSKKAGEQPEPSIPKRQ